jgi:pyruvate/2-oxoglutarate dehydrogenase complex dihydrolipoamide dehydrogenase (E3) component
MSTAFDAIIIGAGQAGPALAAKLAGAGQQVAVIERRHLGGSCINFGCTPTKAMVASARAAWMARHAGEYGVRVHGDVLVDMPAVNARAEKIVEASRRGLREWLESTPGVTLIDGHARLGGAGEVHVEDRSYRAEHIFINTGSRPIVPDLPGLDQVECLTSTHMVGIDRVPDHLVVLGGGYIGVEFAQMFRRFGSAVTLVERHARLLEHEDSDISAAMQSLLEAEGIEVLVAAAATRVARHDRGVVLSVDQGAAGTREIIASDLLLALGRRPNSDELDLEAAAVATDAHGHIRVDAQLHTSVDGIWALGDVNGHGGFTHTAYDDHAIVADELFGDGQRSLEDRIDAYAVYTDPPLGRVGLTEARLRGSGRRVLLASMPMTEVSRARERGETQGLIKLLVDGDSEQLLGAAVLGIAGDEVVHGVLDLMAAGAPYTVLRDSMGIHPTVSELLPSLLERLEPLPARAERAAPGESA